MNDLSTAIKGFFQRTVLVLLSSMMVFGNVTYAHNNVVVIPLGNDSVYAVGETGPAGGVIFYVTNDGLHGLEAAPVDQSAGEEWGCNAANVVSIADLNDSFTPDPNTGAFNSLAIIADCGASTAAFVASGYTGPVGTTGGWYLPNREELILLFSQKNVVGGFTSDDYWSSSEGDTGSGIEAWFVSFSSGGDASGPKNINSNPVRAIRAF